jgi:hypothetical protein
VLITVRHVERLTRLKQQASGQKKKLIFERQAGNTSIEILPSLLLHNYPCILNKKKSQVCIKQHLSNNSSDGQQQDLSHYNQSY